MWASITDSGPTLTQLLSKHPDHHWVNVSCLLGVLTGHICVLHITRCEDIKTVAQLIEPKDVLTQSMSQQRRVSSGSVVCGGLDVCWSVQVTGVITNAAGQARWVLQGTWDDHIECAKVLKTTETKGKMVYETGEKKVIWQRRYPPYVWLVTAKPKGRICLPSRWADTAFWLCTVHSWLCVWELCWDEHYMTLLDNDIQ